MVIDFPFEHLNWERGKVHISKYQIKDLNKSTAKCEIILVWFHSFRILLKLRIIRGDFRGESGVELGEMREAEVVLLFQQRCFLVNHALFMFAHCS